MPLVFGRAEDHPVHRAGEEATISGDRIGERHLHGVVVVVVFVDQHDGPLPVGPFDGIGRDQDVPILILHVARYFEELVNGIDGLYPFLGNYLRRQILRGIIRDVVILVYR